MESSFIFQVLGNILWSATLSRLDVNCHFNCEKMSFGIMVFGSVEGRYAMNGTIVGVIFLDAAAEHPVSSVCGA